MNPSPAHILPPIMPSLLAKKNETYELGLRLYDTAQYRSQFVRCKTLANITLPERDGWKLQRERSCLNKKIKMN